VDTSRLTVRGLVYQMLAAKIFDPKNSSIETIQSEVVIAFLLLEERG
jgi:hypothetical protein